jgi:hypothetical protein
MLLRSALSMVSLLLFTGLGYANDVPRTEALWCAINPSNPKQGQSTKISDDKLRLVLTGEQFAAKAQLINRPFVKITKDEASRLTGVEALSDRSSYLVRASAFYVDENYFFRGQLAAFFYPEDRVLEIVNHSLSQPGALPTNLAIVVDTDLDIGQVDVTCLTAT